MLVEIFTQSVMLQYAEVCGWCLARAHARSGDRRKSAATWARATPLISHREFPSLYAGPDEKDHEVLMKGRARGQVGGLYRTGMKPCNHDRRRSSIRSLSSHNLNRCSDASSKSPIFKTPLRAHQTVPPTRKEKATGNVCVGKHDPARA